MVLTRTQNGHRSARTLWDAGELHRGGMQGVARRSRWAMTTTAVCCKSMARSLSCGRVRYLRKLSLGLRGPDRNCGRKGARVFRSSGESGSHTRPPGRVTVRYSEGRVTCDLLLAANR